MKWKGLWVKTDFLSEKPYVRLYNKSCGKYFQTIFFIKKSFPLSSKLAQKKGRKDMLRYILKYYLLQIKHWTSHRDLPIKVCNLFELHATFDKPNKSCTSCHGKNCHRRCLKLSTMLLTSFYWCNKL